MSPLQVYTLGFFRTFPLFSDGHFVAAMGWG